MALPNTARQLAAPMGLVVTLIVVASWYVTWSTSDSLMALMAMPSAPIGPVQLGLFFALITVMMIAMMLPSTLPMMIAFHSMTRIKSGPVRRGGSVDARPTVAFVAPYFLLWGAFGVVALLGLMTLGLMGPLRGPIALVPGVTLLAAGAYQVTRVKEACLRHCQSPLSFVMNHWRAGRIGALRMGLAHASYCIGCCWLLMIALFVVGSMSLLWMGALSVVIFGEKVGFGRLTFSRAVGALLTLLGGVVMAQFLFIP